MKRRGFTLIELLAVISIIAILGSMLMGAMWRASLTAKADKTQSTVAKLNGPMVQKWEEYRTRRLPCDLRALVAGNATVKAQIATLYPSETPDPNNTRHLAVARLMAIRELQRIEMPDQWEDITTDPLVLPFRTAVSQGLLARYSSNRDPTTGALTPPTAQFESAECLYYFVTMGGDRSSFNGKLGGGGTGVELGSMGHIDVGDTDNDGALEFLDAYGQPIAFLRWAPNLVSELQPDADPSTDPWATGSFDITKVERNTSSIAGSADNHDPFDPRKIDSRAFKMFPLIYSAGLDGDYAWESKRGGAASKINDPYGGIQGQPKPLTDRNGDDNITNHTIAVK